MPSGHDSGTAQQDMLRLWNSTTVQAPSAYPQLDSHNLPEDISSRDESPMASLLPMDAEIPMVQPSLVERLQHAHGLTKKKAYGAKPVRKSFFRDDNTHSVSTTAVQPGSPTTSMAGISATSNAPLTSRHRIHTADRPETGRSRSHSVADGPGRPRRRARALDMPPMEIPSTPSTISSDHFSAPSSPISPVSSSMAATEGICKSIPSPITAYHTPETAWASTAQHENPPAALSPNLVPHVAAANSPVVSVLHPRPPHSNPYPAVDRAQYGVQMQGSGVNVYSSGAETYSVSTSSLPQTAPQPSQVPIAAPVAHAPPPRSYSLPVASRNYSGPGPAHAQQQAELYHVNSAQNRVQGSFKNIAPSSNMTPHMAYTTSPIAQPVSPSTSWHPSGGETAYYQRTPHSAVRASYRTAPNYGVQNVSHNLPRAASFDSATNQYHHQPASASYYPAPHYHYHPSGGQMQGTRVTQSSSSSLSGWAG